MAGHAAMPPIVYASVSAALDRAGLVCRGGFAPAADDGVPDFGDGQPSAFVVLAGNVGPGMWRAFAASPEYLDGEPDPLDRWSRRVLDDVAAELGGPGVCQTVFPFDGPPHFPFQRWAQKAETVFPSPTGPLIHAEYGLWHAFRGALIFSTPPLSPRTELTASPCLACADQPCLTTCPVEAFSAEAYDVPACVAHLQTIEGTDCMATGCRARRACPVGRDYAYAPAQAAFHTAAFLKGALASNSKD